jgi:hypothetical protein
MFSLAVGCRATQLANHCNMMLPMSLLQLMPGLGTPLTLLAE